MTAITTPVPQEAREIIDRARKLPPSVLQSVVTELIYSLESTASDAEDVRTAWKAEIARRVEDVVSGRSRTHDADAVIAELRGHLARRRKP